MWILMKQEAVSGSCISWAICKSAPRSRQITMPAPHHLVFFTGRMPFLSANQQRQSTEGTIFKYQFVANLPPSLSSKDFENRLTFGEVMGKGVVSCFF